MEDTQWDLSSSLVNELAMVFDCLGIDTAAVLATAATMWDSDLSWLGLVGGRTIGGDPYYLAASAEQVGVQPRVILAGRRTSSALGDCVATATIKQRSPADADKDRCRVLVVAVAFNDDVSDLWSKGVVAVLDHLNEYGMLAVWDPVCGADAVKAEYGVDVSVIPGIRETRTR